MDIDSPARPSLKRRLSTSSSTSAPSSPQRHKRPTPFAPPPPPTTTHSAHLSSSRPFALHIRGSFRPYWYPNGDVVLAVCDHLFKLPRALLRCSEVFGDMFALADPALVEDAGLDTFEGCPVVHLQDAPGDWAVVLRWLDDPTQFWSQAQEYATLAGALRLSTKYEIPALRTPTVRALEGTWPRMTRLHRLRAHGFNAHRVDAIALARQCDLPEILPALFYSLGVEYDAAGVLPPGLSEGDEERVRRGAGLLRDFCARATGYVARIGSCPNLQGLWAAELAKPAPGVRATCASWMFALAEVNGYHKVGDMDGFGVCEECQVSYIRFMNDGVRRKLQDEVPGMFGL